MDIKKAIETIRNHPDSHRIGMIASHLGIVRGSSRDGREVVGIEVKYDMAAVEDIREKIKAMPGIVEVIVEIRDGSLNVGDEILLLAVGGDIRENVFTALMEGVNLIKKNGSRKTEIYKD
jgi:molybdopterin synthase catalytic subunit